MRLIGSVLLVLISSLPTVAQEPTPAEPSTPPASTSTPSRPGFTLPSSDPQPYEKVITKDAKTKFGIFRVHQIKDKYYYEIPKRELDKEFLWVSQIARTTQGVGYGGQALGNMVVRWERNGNKVHLREINYEVMADPRTEIARAVRNANNEAIIMTFPVAAFGKDEAAVIDVTRLFTSDVFELSAKQRLNATMLDSSRSYIERIATYPANVEVEASMTYSKTPAPAGMPQSSTPTNSMFGAGMRPGSATVVVHYSMVKLPEKPMMPRLFDERVGYFTTNYLDFGRDEHHAVQRRFITRWRLEKKDPSAALSEPVKPIVYWIDSATPAKWVPYMKAGVEKWQKAFEAAGFKNAIIAKLAPTPEQDPDFSPEDARYSVIRWLPSTVENAMGPNIHDPRTGEILDSDIQFYHNVMNLQRSWYFLQAGPLDPRAQKLPLPDALMGKLIEFVCAHEVGHTLGFQHNMKASSTYPQEKVRDREWVHKMGHAPSIMDYSRFNYVAQPEDKIDVDDLIPGIGPYDIWATKWGYAPIAGAKSSDDEKKTLDQWAREQDETPWLRFSTPGAGGADPGELTEAVGDADAVKSTTLGLKNLKRVAKMLLPATTAKPGETYEDLAELYGRMLGQWTLELNHVTAIVGGVETRQKVVGQAGLLYQPVAKARQQEAVKFLNENAFATPTWAIDAEILRRIEPVGGLNRVRNAQASVLNNLLSAARFARVVEQEAIDGKNAYPAAEFLADVRKGVWKELDAPRVQVDAYRRNLQRAWLDLANTKLNGPSMTVPMNLPPGFPVAMFITSGDEKPYYRAELRKLSAALSVAQAKAADAGTRAHLEASRDQIARILDPKFQAQQSSSTSTIVTRSFDDARAPETCWPDYIIRP